MQQPAAIIGGKSTICQQLLFLIQQTIMSVLRVASVAHSPIHSANIL